MSDKKTEELFEKALSAVATTTATSPRRGPRFFMSIADKHGVASKVEVPDAKRFSAYVSGVKNKSKIQHWFAYHDNKISHWESGMQVMNWHPPFGYRFDAKDAKKAIEEFNTRVPHMGDVLADAVAKNQG